MKKICFSNLFLKVVCIIGDRPTDYLAVYKTKTPSVKSNRKARLYKFIQELTQSSDTTKPCHQDWNWSTYISRGERNVEHAILSPPSCRVLSGPALSVGKLNYRAEITDGSSWTDLGNPIWRRPAGSGLVRCPLLIVAVQCECTVTPTDHHMAIKQLINKTTQVLLPCTSCWQQ